MRAEEHPCLSSLSLTIALEGTNPLADMFPIGSNTGDTQLNPRPATAADDEAAALDAMVQTATSELRPRSVIPESEADVPRPGSSYARYRMESDLPETARPFYERVAKVAGVSLATLVRSVSQAENRIIRWLDEQRRIEYFGGFETESSEDSDDDLGRLSEDSMSDLDN